MLTLEQLTPEQKLGRVLCARRFTEEEDIEFTLELVRNQACGCVQIPFFERTDELIKRFREAADYPLLIINDMETGFPLSSLPKIPLISLAACENKEYVRAFAAAIAKEASERGYNGCWGPVIDILYTNKPFGVSRAAGDTPETVVDVAREMQAVFKSYHFQGTGKHYPGGKPRYPIDTHMVAAISDDTEETLLKMGLKPYLVLLKEGLLPTIMSGHQVIEAIDPGVPASLSKKVIDIIRNAGFDGVMYTDSLAMMGILQKYGEKKSLAMALMAGNDMLVTNLRISMKRTYEIMLELYRAGEITDERLDEAVGRIMKLEQYCAQKPENPYPVAENTAQLLNAVARDCITADCDAGITPAIDPEKPRLFIVVKPQDDVEPLVGQETAVGNWYHAEEIVEGIKERFPASRIETVREFPDRGENERVLAAATGYDEVVVVSYCSSSSYTGTDCLTRRMEMLINCLVIPGKVKAIVHFGNPLALANLMPIPRKIFGYIIPESQMYALDVLAGRIPAKGKIPFPRLYQR